ncbi:MAG TPA: protein kinase [Verrucomicrobiae bacterium]|nr:protein kinase [Verrucomicrobiae bacterium]
MNTEVPKSACRKCGRPLSQNDPRGLCAHCLVAGVLGHGLLAGGASSAATGALLPRAFGSYELLEEVARGGMGVVYRARQTQANRLVAVKVLTAGAFAAPDFVKRFRTEAEAVASLDHPHIIPIYEVGECEGQPFFSMKLVESGTLAERIAKSPPTNGEAAILMCKLARAVHFAHQRGILHRDIKPGNVLLEAQGEPLLSDFGLAKLVEKESTLTRTIAMLGTPSYMSPEQALGKAKQLTTAVDVYGLGAVFYEMLTDLPPFAGGTTLETVRQVLDKEPRRPASLKPGTDRDLETICLKCLEKDPTHRYGSAEALAEELERWLNKEPIHARPSTRVERALKWAQRNPRIATLTTLLGLVLSVGLGGILVMSAHLASANRATERANVELAKNLRDFEWQKVDELVAARKRSLAMASLSAFLRENPNDRPAAMRLVSMMRGCNFALPAGVTLQHGAMVNSICLSADGQRLLTASNDGKSWLWNLATGRLLATLAHAGKVNETVFAADEQFALSTCQDGTITLWDLNRARVAFEFPKAPNLSFPAVLSRDRRRAILPETGSSAQVWDLLTQQKVGPPMQMPTNLVAAAFGRDSRTVAIAAEDGTVNLWDIEMSSPAISSLTVSGRPTCLELSPDGNLLAIAWDRSITLWDVAGRTKLREFIAADYQVLLIEFSPDGSRLVTTAFDRPVIIWEVATGKMLGQPIEAERPFAYFRLSPDGRRLATRSQNGVARVWDALTGLPLSEPFEHEGPITDLRFVPNGPVLLTSSQDGTVQGWELQTAEPAELAIKTSDVFPSACFSRDGRVVFRTSDGRVEAFDTRTGEPTGMRISYGAQILRVKLSPDGKKLATTGADNTGRVWDAQTGQPVSAPLEHRSRLYGIAFSPDNRLVATCSEDQSARLWDAATGQTVGMPMLHHGEVLSAQFSPDSRALLTASTDGTACLWSSDTGKSLWTQPVAHKGIVWSTDFSPDGQRIVTASADRSAIVRDARSGQPLTRPMQHEHSVYGARFSPDGKWIVTCSEDETARVWDSVSGEPVSQPMRHADKLALGAFSPDGQFVLTGCLDGTARLWDARTGYPVGEPLRHAGSIYGIEFSPDGRHCLSIARSDALRIWEVSQPPIPVPGWFCDFVEAVAGKRLNASHDAEPVSREALQAFRLKLANSPGNQFYDRWAGWFLNERLKNPAPKFAQ